MNDTPKTHDNDNTLEMIIYPKTKFMKNSNVNKYKIIYITYISPILQSEKLEVRTKDIRTQ